MPESILNNNSIETQNGGNSTTNGLPVETLDQTHKRLEKEISAAKLAANRANALHSTGARTPEGHQRSSMNALRHGMTSKSALLPGEDAAAYEAFIQSHFDRYSPATDEENELVQSIADTAYRLLKVPDTEQSMIEVRCVHQGGNLYLDQPQERRQFLVTAYITLSLERELKNLHIQERRLRVQHKEDIARLKELQAERIAKPEREAQAAAEEKQRPVKRIMSILAHYEPLRSSGAPGVQYGISTSPLRQRFNVQEYAVLDAINNTQSAGATPWFSRESCGAGVLSSDVANDNIDGSGSTALSWNLQ